MMFYTLAICTLALRPPLLSARRQSGRLVTSQLAAGGEEPLQAALLPEALAASGAEPELAGVLCSIAAACEQISELLRMPQFESPAAGRALNVQGERQKPMDVIANDIFVSHLTGRVAAMASEEERSCILGDTPSRYEVGFDPLDGSSNLDTRPNIGILERETRRVYHHAASTPGNRDLRPSPRQAAAACQQAARRDIRRHVHLRSAAPL